MNEQFFSGAFPHSAGMPGVLIVEALAKPAARSGHEKPRSGEHGGIIYFMGMDHVRFRPARRPSRRIS